MGVDTDLIVESDRSAIPRPPPRPVRLFVSCMLTWLIPFAIFSLFMNFADLRPPWSSIPLFDPRVTLYVLGCAAAAAGWITWRYMNIRRRDSEGAALEETRDAVRGVLYALPLILMAYLGVGTILALTLASAQNLLGANFLSPGSVLVAALCGLVIYFYILLPLGLVCLDEFGVAFGHALEDRPIVSMWLRTSPGLIMVAMIGTALVLQEYIRSGELAHASLVLVLTMIPYAIVVMLLNMRYTGNTLASISRFIESARDGRSVAAMELRAESLDQIGVMYVHIARLVRQLEASEKRLRTFADAASDFLFETDAANRVTWVSERVEQVLGVRPNVLVGRSFTMLAKDFDLGLGEQEMEVLWTYQPFRDYVISFPRPNGKETRIRLSAVPAFDEHGLFEGYRGVGTDVTAVASAEERLREREAQLAQAQKMEAVGQLTGGVAHDFNNLLLVVAGNLELAREEEDTDDRAELIDHALDAAQRGASLVQHLLAFSRRQVLRPEAFDLHTRLDGLRSLMRTTLGERVELSVEISADVSRPLIDGAQFESALLNLAINARDAMPRGGEFRVRAGNRRIVAAKFGLAPGEYIEVRVEDTGTGMPASVLERVFEPFFSTKAVGAGSGLGLSMVYGFVTQSKGAIDIQSREGFGTTITLLLPIAQETEETAEEPQAPIVRASRGERILMVEDEPEVRKALTAGLEAAGYVVVSAPDADAGKALHDSGLEIDLLLSDVVVPGERSGVDLVAELRRERPHLPCLLMSGYTDDHLRETVPELDEVMLLSKPFRMKALLQNIDRLLEERPSSEAPHLRLVASAPPDA